MKTATLHDLANAEAKSLYSNFTDTLRLLRETTDPKVKQMWVQELQDQHHRAYELQQSGACTSLTSAGLNIILGRTPEQWVSVTKGGTLVPTW